ncbi:MAG: AAA domain-containing protein [Nitrospira sp.]|nr:AAA domain-containing protein [Nitrospira sp.]
MTPKSSAKERLVQTFKFLKELNELRNPVPRDLSGADVMRIDTWPSHPSVQVRRGDHPEDEVTDAAEMEMEPLIRIQRARLTPCPAAPAILDGWLKPGWQSVDAEVHVLESRHFRGKDKQTSTAAVTDDQERIDAFNEWTVVRAKWADAERVAIAARQLFERIHALWTMMQREGDHVELVLADGVLSVPEHCIQHPVLLQRINLEFDPALPEFCLTVGTEQVELHRALLRLVPSIEGRMIAHFDKDLEGQPVEPLGGERTASFFRRLVQGLFTDGEFLEGKGHGAAPTQPSIWREPLMFLRPRTAGLNTTLDYILEDLNNPDTQAPEGLSRIVGVETPDTVEVPTSGDNEEPRVTTGPEPDVLFSKPANTEQYDIAARVTTTKSVLVQGPPGTGKTHTIANLLGYLLSQGKTVLVTAHTTKALRVLRRQVDDALQPLALSVLDSDAESQAQLSRAAQDIADRLSRSDAASLRREAGLFRDKRRTLLDENDALRRRLRDARFSEVEEIVLGGERLSPIEVARRVKADTERDGWIPGPLQSGIVTPLTDGEVRQLYGSQETLTPADEAQLAVPQPALAELVAPADFRLLATERAGAELRAQAHRPELWNGHALASYTTTQLQDLHQRVKQAAAILAEEHNWLREVLFAGWSGGGLQEAWQDLLAIVETLASESGTAHRLIMAYGPALPGDHPLDDAALMLGDIVAFLEAGGSFGLKTKLTRRAWHHLIESCRVEGREPRTLEEFRALHASAQLETSRNRFTARWRRAVESLDGPSVESLGRSPERTAQAYAAEIRTRLEWRGAVWEPLIEELRTAGFHWDVWLAAHSPVPGDHGELARVQRAGSHGLAEIVEAQAALLRQAELSTALQAQRTYLTGFPQSDVALRLLQAQDAWDVDNYEGLSREIARLEGLRNVYDNRLTLLAKLEPTAPAWAQAIAKRHMPHDHSQPPGNAEAAWRWRQWLQELERRAAVSMTDLQGRLDRMEEELRHVAGKIIEYETWAAQRDRTALHTQQALMGFVQTIHKVGKGTGKRVPELLRRIRELLVSARRAVPVWIMPLSRVYESFDPRNTKFDVVIIDEASQSDVTALAALYLGHEHVVVGDKEQVTPDAVGQRLDEVQRLIATDLRGVPNSHLYDGQTSIYDLAETAFGSVIALREHFRCVPEIIEFCNQLSYSHAIRPLREPLSASLRPALVAHHVQGFRDGQGKINRVEAEEIASLVCACLNDPAYAQNESGRPTSFGIISLLGDEQALLIESLLRKRLSPDVFEKHRLLCGNAAQFQGDERDVVFLSMVDGPPVDGQLPCRDAGPKDLYKKRYNVAVSRARNQLWLIHSLDPDAHLKDGDLRRRLIQHARDPQAILQAKENYGKQTDSVLENQVLQRLLDAGYRVQPQWPVGAYRIDLVVEGKNRRLAVECDGEKWHTPEQLQRDLERQGILERLGWVFVRVRGSVFFRDPETAMAPVFTKLNRLGIEPMKKAELHEPTRVERLVGRIKRAAEKLRQDWAKEQMALGEDSEYEYETQSAVSSTEPAQSPSP